MEQKIISYASGITRSPDDIIAPDGHLAECINLEVKNGSVYPMEQPTDMNINIGNAKLLIVHNTSDNFKNYISYIDNKLIYNVNGGEEAIDLVEVGNEPASVVTIGNTLSINTDEGILYVLWKNNAYKRIGYKPPLLEAEAWLQSYSVKTQNKKLTLTVGLHYADIDTIHSGVSVSEIVYEKGWELLDDTFQGEMNKIAQEVKKEGRFLYPFFVRFAYRLFDGNYIMHSNPILLVPNDGISPLVEFYPMITYEDSSSDDTDTYPYHSLYFKSDLWAAIKTSKEALADWSDIVKSVEIFISKEFPTRDQNAKRNGNVWINPHSPVMQSKSMCRKRYGQMDGKWYDHTMDSTIDYLYSYPGDHGLNPNFNWVTLYYSIRANYKKELENNGAFYHIHSIDVRELDNNGFNVIAKCGKEILEFLEQRPTLDDDYQTHDKIYSKYFEVYNRRLNIANVKRKLFGGFHAGFFQTIDKWETLPSSGEVVDRGEHWDDVEIFTYISSDGSDIIVKSEKKSGVDVSYLPYLFYPDANAYKMVIKTSTSNNKLVFNLIPHPALNGAYFFDISGKPSYTETSTIDPVASVGRYVEADNKLYTSAIGNPFYFPLKGIVTVGIGEIKAISALTVPISQGQFGQYPMLAFCSDGNYALAVDDEGFYKSVSPIQNDAVLSNEQITSREGSILAITKKGIMETNGYQMNLLTAQMDGAHFDTSVLPLIETKLDVYQYQFSKTYDSDGFLTYLYGARIAYDYSSNRVFIYNKDKPYSYVMNLDSGTFSKFVLPNEERIVNHVMDYPNTIIQTNTGRLLSLYEKQDMNTLTDRRYGVMVSRPMVLDAPLDLKTVRQLKNMGSFHAESWAKYSLYGSNDGENWVYIVSRHGKPFKYYRIAIYVYGLPKEALSGTAFFFETRRTHRPR